MSPLRLPSKTFDGRAILGLLAVWAGSLTTGLPARNMSLQGAIGRLELLKFVQLPRGKIWSLTQSYRARRNRSGTLPLIFFRDPRMDYSPGGFFGKPPPGPPKNFSRPSAARPARGVGGSAHRRSVSAEHIFVRMPAFLRKPPASGQGVSCCDGVLRTPSRNESFPGGLGGRLSKRPPRTIERNSGLEEAAKWPASKCTRIVLGMKKVFNESLRMGWKRTLHSIS